MSKIIYFCIVCVVFVNAQKISYEGYRLYQVLPTTDGQVKSLETIKKNGFATFWEEIFNVNSDVKAMVSRENEKEFLEITKNEHLKPKIIIENLQRAIEDQLKPALLDSRDSSSFHSLTWNSYHTLEEIYTWLDELVTAYPDIVSPITIGSSFENRPIRGIIINYHPEITYTSVGILESTIHAREWIAPAAVTWIIKEFLTSTDPEIRELAEGYEWHIFPVVNPDGYAYTFTTNRMWRKNRNVSYFTSCNTTGVLDDMSNGVDLNRNFDFVWNTAGTSPDPCSNTYPGPTAFSEPETRAIAQYVRNVNERANIAYYLAFHSYTQLVILPYSHINGFNALMATNYADMYEIGIRGADRIQNRFGTNYRVGVSMDVMYAMSGTSFDWVKYTTQVPIAYLLELRDLGEYGFLLPPQQIIPTGLETMDFLVEMNKNAKGMGYNVWLMSSASIVHVNVLFTICIVLGMLF
ncbi:zinc carboxypeptidase-like [Plodia interpunctella]|uniref:zinc carboxypeptidase-like n=1 Tax=Plodia interpunctella TaxID=58824 RepID=UPI0023680CFB|nr:zinc carboxypeptidase-like [Plodia interpunctella]